jgi:hypothetical protein
MNGACYGQRPQHQFRREQQREAGGQRAEDPQRQRVAFRS